MTKNYQALIDALQEVKLDGTSEGMTAQEIADQIGRDVKWVRQRLAEQSRLGRLVIGRRIISRIDGRSTTIPVYRLRGGK